MKNNEYRLFRGKTRLGYTIPMKRKKRFAGLFKYFLPYTVVILIACLVITLLFSTLFLRQTGVILQNVQVQQLKSATRIFSQIQLQNIPVYVETTWNGPVSDFLYSSSLPAENILRAFESLQRMILGNEYLDSLYIYNKNLGVVSTRYGWEIRRKISDPELLPMLNNIRDYGLSRFLTRQVRFDGDPGPGNYFTIILGTLPSGDTMFSAFVANISEAKVRKALDSDNSSIYSMYIVSYEHQFLSHPDPELFGGSADRDVRFSAILGEPGREGTIPVRDEAGVRWLASWTDHPEMRWRFIMLAPEQSVYSQIFRLRNTIIAIAAVLLTAALLTSFIISLGIADREQMIKLRLSFLRREMDWEPEMSRKTPFLWGGFLSPKLFPGLRESCVMAILIADEGYGIPDLETALYEEAGKIIRHREIVSLSDTRFAVLFEPEEEQVEPLLLNLVSAIHGAYHLDMGGFFLSRQVSIDQLPLAYQVLWNALRRCDYLRASQELVEVFLDSDSQVPETKVSPVSSDLNFSAIERAFKLGDPEKAGIAIENLCSELRKAKDADLFYYARSNLRYKLSDIPCREYISERDFEKILGDLRQSSRLDKLEAALKSAEEIIKKRADYAGERRKWEIIETIKAIISRRIGEKNLGTALIASEVNLSANYVRGLFKRIEGQALSDYISQARVASAVKLLKESRLSIREISERAGFINHSYFFTYFKKFTGKTPAEYRNDWIRDKQIN
ncbi:MAG: helix-turn-helix domain-containing protein [Treponema sp.]|jgi:AraC-like DNA-binding protein|nr:helix-turn-helix domain-containing protein [Treponema sp.]